MLCGVLIQTSSCILLGRCYKEKIPDGECTEFEEDAYNFYAMCGPNADDPKYKCDDDTLHNGLTNKFTHLAADHQCAKRPPPPTTTTAIPPKTDDSKTYCSPHCMDTGLNTFVVVIDGFILDLFSVMATKLLRMLRHKSFHNLLRLSDHVLLESGYVLVKEGHECATDDVDLADAGSV